jgi:two-component system CheB/CheR fusion protein
LKERRAIRGMAAVAERPDGTRVPFLAYPTPLYDRSGNLAGAVNVLIDASEHEASEHDASRLASIVESSDDAIVSKDIDGTIRTWNRGAERLFGYNAAETVGLSVSMLIPADRHDEEPSILQRICRGERVEPYETVRRRKDGSLVEVSLTVSPIRNAEGRIIGASKIARDITERRRAQQQQTLVLAEMRHRVKNTLATVQAIASQSLRSAAAEERAAFADRLQALGRAHDLLSLENWDRAALRDVVLRGVAAYHASHPERFVIEGPDQVWLSASRSLLVTMALHELATNAVRHGALSNAGGRVHIAWERRSDRVSFAWREIGGPPVKPRARKGFGSLLVERGLGTEFGRVDLAFEPAGLSCRFEIPL